MTDDHPMGALSPTCKSDDDADADIAGPLIVLLPPQAAITVEIDNDGDVILRQECALGGDPDQIVISRANLSAFLEALIGITPHGRSFGLGGVPPEWSAEPHKKPKFGSLPHVRSPAAERQRRCRARKRAAATGEPLPSDGSTLDAGVTSTPDRPHRAARYGSITPGAAMPTD